MLSGNNKRFSSYIEAFLQTKVYTKVLSKGYENLQTLKSVHCHWNKKVLRETIMVAVVESVVHLIQSVGAQRKLAFFSCKEAALEGQNSLCPSVVKLKLTFNLLNVNL